MSEAVQIEGTWRSCVETRRLEFEKKVGALRSNSADNLAEPWGHKVRDTEQGAVGGLDNRDPVGAERCKKRHTDMRGNICKVCTAPHLQVEGSQVHLATVDRRLQKEVAEDSNLAHLRPWVAQEGNMHNPPEAACHSIALQGLH